MQTHTTYTYSPPRTYPTRQHAIKYLPTRNTEAEPYVPSLGPAGAARLPPPKGPPRISSSITSRRTTQVRATRGTVPLSVHPDAPQLSTYHACR